MDDPNKISQKQEKKVKAYVRQFFEKAVEKRKELDKRKKEKEKARLANGNSGSPEKVNGKAAVEEDGKAEDIDLTPTSPSPPGAPSSPHASTATPSVTESSPELKRKRTGEETPGDESDSKRLKEEDSTPPPPPPPPEGMPDPMDGLEPGASKEETEEEKELRRQEEDLMRENEEAIKMEQDGTLQTAEENAQHHLSLNGNGVKSAPGPGNGEMMEGVEDTNGSGMKNDGKGVRR